MHLLGVVLSAFIVAALHSFTHAGMNLAESPVSY